ncbi:MAG: RNA polymerase sigma factor [Bacteroidaceae bacterium]|nr:RNA polymerase sigma factor [Bacteroidaceae bacterium]
MNYGEIIDGCNKGQQRAQMEFYALFSREVYATAYRLLGNVFDAEEVMQEAMLKVLTDRTLLLGEQQNMLRRIKRIAINASIDILRRGNICEPWNDNIDAEEELGFEELLMREERVALLYKAIDELPTGYRSVVLLFVVEELGCNDIAQILNIKASAVRSQLARAKKRIIEWFENYERGR